MVNKIIIDSKEYTLEDKDEALIKAILSLTNEIKKLRLAWRGL